MKLIWFAFGIALLSTMACNSGTTTMRTPTTSRPAETVSAPLPTPTAQPHPVGIDRIADALDQAAQLPGGTQLWVQEDGDRGNIWGIGLCGIAAGPRPTARIDRIFAGRRQPDVTVTGMQLNDGFVIESVLVFPPGDAAQFMTDLRGNADACRSALRPTGRELFGGGTQFPQIRNESQVYSVESFSCCVTPLPTDDQQPHDIVYIRQGDVILHIYGTDGAVIEPAARRAEDRVDGVPTKDN